MPAHAAELLTAGGVAAAPAVAVDVPPAGVRALGGGPVAPVFPGAEPAGHSGQFSLFRSGPWLLGRAGVRTGDDLAGLVAELYAGLLLGLSGEHVCRTWNYVPRINAPGPDGLENYRAFSAGRSLAFERHFGRAFKCRLPASSAVGTAGGDLAVVFAAHRAVPRHFENPAQVPAYEYPAEHGPRPPSFSRATVVAAGGRADVLIAGTAAIRGHATQAPGDTRAQLAVTLDNLRLISRVAGLGDDLGAGRGAARRIRVYLRHAADHRATAAALAGTLVRPGDTVSYFEADLCRAELNVEIEVAVFGAELAA